MGINLRKTAIILGSLSCFPMSTWGQAQLEEITVTSEQREASLQDTALSVSAYTGEMLDQAGADNLETMQGLVPNLMVGFIANTVQISTRGIKNGDSALGGDPTTPIHIDGVYLPLVRSMGAVFYDLERVEFLRGPQGTLYGRNATAGNINVITRKPEEEFEGWVDAQIGEYSERVVRGAVNLPISATVQARLAAYTGKRDGYYDNDGVGSDYTDLDEQSIRGHLLYEPTATLSILLSASYTESDHVGPGATPLANRNDDPWEVAINSPGRLETEVITAGIEINWNIGDVLVTSVTGYRDDEQLTSSELDWRNNNNSNDDFDTTSESFSQELRFTSMEPLAGWDWLVGLYYFEEDRLEDRVLSFDGFPMPGTVGNVVNDFDEEITSSAIFANLTRDLTDTLELAVGARYNYDTKEKGGSSNFVVMLPPGAPLPPGPPPLAPPVDGSGNFEQTSWNIGLNWRPTDESMYYLKIGTGYKAGGFNNDSSAFDQETVKSYEIGSKNQFLDNRLQLNASVFYQEYKDMQRSQATLIFNGGVPSIAALTRNAAEATTKGIELESIFLVTEALQIDLNLAYLDTEFDDYIAKVATFSPAPSIVDIDNSGNDLAGAADWSLNLGVQYTWDLGNSGWLTARVNVYSEGDSAIDDFNVPDIHEQDGFTKTDIRLAWTSAEDTFSVEGFVKNIEDEEVARSTFDLPTSGDLYQLMPPRTYGVKVGYRW